MIMRADTQVCPYMVHLLTGQIGKSPLKGGYGEAEGGLASHKYQVLMQSEMNNNRVRKLKFISPAPCVYTVRARRMPLYQPFWAGHVQKHALVAERQADGSLNQLPPRVIFMEW